MPAALLPAQTGRWRRRAPRLALCLAVLLTQVPLVMAETVLESDVCSAAAPCRYPLGSAVYHLSAMAELLAVAAAVLSLLLPRAAVWVAAVAALLLGGPAATDSSFPALWAAAAVVLMAIGALDLLGRLRQDAESRGWGGIALPYPDVPSGTPLPGHLPRDEDTRWLAAVVLLVGVIMTSALAVWHVGSTAQVRDFEASAIRSTGTVTTVSDDGDTVTISVAGRHARLEPMGAYHRGQQVPVLVDAADPSRFVLAAEPDDPSWRGGLAAVVLAATLALAGRLWSRGYRRARLVHGGPAVRLRLGRVPEGVLVTSVDDEAFRRPLALVKQLLPSGVLLPFARVDDVDHDLAPDELDPDDALGEAPTDVSTVSDAELAAWADQVVADAASSDDDVDDEADAAFHPLTPAARGGEVATVIGLHQDGDPVAVLLTDGQTLVSSGGIRDPWTWAWLRRTVSRRDRAARADGAIRPESRRRPAPTMAPTPRTSRVRDVRRGVLRVALRLLAPVGLPLAIVLALMVFPLVRWILDGGSSLSDLRLLIPVAVLASWLRVLAGLKQPALRPHRLGLLHSGWWFDELIPARRVTSVVAGHDSVVLRLQDPADAMALPAGCTAPFAGSLGEPVTADHCAATIHGWLAQAMPSAATGWRRPSPTLAPPAVAVVGSLLAWVLPRLTG